jgi:hypothetical protein
VILPSGFGPQRIDFKARRHDIRSFDSGLFLQYDTRHGEDAEHNEKERTDV